MYMEDYVEHLDRILEVTSGRVLNNAGKTSHKQAIEKAMKEYRKYQTKTLSPVEVDYLDRLKEIEHNKGKK